MIAEIDYAALAVFVFFFGLVAVMGLAAAHWRRPKTLAHLDEWGLGGRQFGTWITWFLIGGDVYTAYTMIAVPALVYAVGAYGFFALPYAIIVYPFVFTAMPVLWTVAKAHNHVTAADVVLGRYASRPLELAVALTGVLATMPYIALQLIGMETIIHALGLEGKIPLAIAFLILAFYDYSSGLRAPALVAFVKDTMIYIVVLVAIALIPLKLGGYGAVFEAADAAFKAKGSGGILLNPDQYIPYASLAFGSALALFMYPHALTGIFASASADTIRKNAMLLPAYTLLLGLVALLGYMGHAAGLKLSNNNDVVPLLFKTLFPAWFTGFAFAAIAIGALVPAAIMSIGAANLFTRNFWKAYVDPLVTPAGEAKVAKITSLAVKAGALLVILFLPTQFALDLQLLGGLWILQTFPALIFGLYTGWFRAHGLLAGWAVGFSGGTWMVWLNDFKPLHTLHFGGTSVTLYSGLLALAANILVAILVSAALRFATRGNRQRDEANYRRMVPRDGTRAMNETQTLSCRCCIVGGGPAGMMLGLLLARAGVDTIVVEKHADFLRDFRGDTIHPSTLEAMHELGLLDDFLKLPHQEIRQAEGKIGDVAIPLVDFSHLPVHARFVALLPQWDFLDFLAERAKRYPCFRLLMSAEVDGLIEEEGRVAGVTAKTKDGVLTIRADLTIGADGRHSLVRREAGFASLDIGAPMDVLWFRLARRTTDAGALLGRIDAGQILAVFNRGEYWQCAYVIAKGSADRLKAQGIESLRQHIAQLAPFLADRVAELESFDDIKLLTVAVDRLPLWHKPGLLCIGDAAHAMSPVGGVGINLAIQDAIAAANILAGPLFEKGQVSDQLLAQVQKRREWPTKVIQGMQVALQKTVISRVLGGTGKTAPPWFLRLFIYVPVLRRLPARLIGLGVRRERVTSPARAIPQAANHPN